MGAAWIAGPAMGILQEGQLILDNGVGAFEIRITERIRRMTEAGHTDHMMPGAITDVFRGKLEVQSLSNMVDEYPVPNALDKGQTQFGRLGIPVQFGRIRIVGLRGRRCINGIRGVGTVRGRVRSNLLQPKPTKTTDR